MTHSSSPIISKSIQENWVILSRGHKKEAVNFLLLIFFNVFRRPMVRRLSRMSTNGRRPPIPGRTRRSIFRWKVWLRGHLQVLKFILFSLYTLFEKSNFCPKIQFWQNPNIFTSFSPKIFLTIFLVKSKLSTAKKSKTTAFSRVFQPEKSTIFSGNQSWIFGPKIKISNSVFSSVNILLLKVNHEVWRMYNLAKGFFFWVLHLHHVGSDLTGAAELLISILKCPKMNGL